MIHKTQSPVPGHVRVIFELPSCIWADRIFLVGDFNQWDERTTPLRQDRDGVWRAIIDLANGSQCEFRYLIDGQWKTDYHADGSASNAYGSENSVVHAVLPQGMPMVERLSSRVLDSAPRARTPVAPSPQPVQQRALRLERARRTALVPVQAAA